MDYMTSQIKKIWDNSQYMNTGYSLTILQNPFFSVGCKSYSRISRVFNQVAYESYYNILGGITTFNLCFNVRTFIQSFKRTFKKSEYIRMQIRFPSYARITNSGHLFRAFY